MAGANGPTSAAGTPDVPNPSDGTKGGKEREKAGPTDASVDVERPTDKPERKAAGDADPPA